MATKAPMLVLCVDDEPQVLEGLVLHLRRRWDVATAVGGLIALEQLDPTRLPAVVISDMRMPGMSGAAFLHELRLRAPDSVRILLTGQTDLESAIAAVNEGQLFRFLTKPCPPPVMIQAVEAAVEQHRLITAERVLLEQTLQGSIRALTDVLGLAHPLAFGSANQVKQRVTEVAEQLELPNRWQVEVAAMLSNLGTVAVPLETLENSRRGRALSKPEQEMMARVPALTEQLIAHIPRLEAVREILSAASKPPPVLHLGDAARQHLVLGGQILRAVLHLDVLEGQGHSTLRALEVLRGRAEQYEGRVLTALSDLLGATGGLSPIRELALEQVRPGMVFAEDVRLANGTLLVASGFEVTPSFMARMKNFAPGSVHEPVRVCPNREA